MSKKKSLGSSPIEYKSQKSSMDFIPDLGVSTSTEKTKKSSFQPVNKQDKKQEAKKDKEKKKKQIVSYSLEAELVSKIKKIADKKEIYYSSLVSQALKNWIGQHS